MKKSILLLSLFTLVCSTSCGSLNDDDFPTVFCPMGSTLIGIADYAYSHQDIITLGNPSLIPAAMLNEQYDVVIAPLTAGLNIYSKAQNYVLDNIFVWGNLYILSNDKLDSITQLEGKTISSFQKDNTPGVVLESILKNKKINCTINYLSDVSSVAASFLSGTADYIVCAEPSVQNILTKKPNTNIIDLQNVYAEINGSESYPQAGIFVSKKYIESHDNYDDYLQIIRESVLKTNENPMDIAEKSVALNPSFESIGVSTLAKSIPGSHFDIKSLEIQKKSITNYIKNSNDILNTKYEIPGEEFYL